MSVVTVADDQLVKYRSITMFRIKICGVRCSADIAAVARADGDAIGLNFYPPSIRYVDPADPLTKQISIEARQQGLLRVGVFVNESAESIAEILSDIGLDADHSRDQVARRTADGKRDLYRSRSLVGCG
jgi:hypothetical protein